MKKYLIVPILALIWFFSCFYLASDWFFWEKVTKTENQFMINTDFSSNFVFPDKDNSWGKICDINQTFSCTDVSNNEVSQLFWIPFSVYAMIMFFTIFLLWILAYIKKNDLYISLIFIPALIWVFVNIYLVYLEAFVINSFCIVCIFCSLLLLTIFFISSKSVLKCITKQ